MVAHLYFRLKENASDIEGQFKPSVRYNGHSFLPGSRAIVLSFMSNKIETSLRATVECVLLLPRILPRLKISIIIYPRFATSYAFSLIDGWQPWTDFSSRGTKGYFMYPYASIQEGDGLFCYFDWFSKTLTRFLPLRQDIKFRHGQLCTRVCGLSRERREKLPLVSHLDSQRKIRV